MSITIGWTATVREGCTTHTYSFREREHLEEFLDYLQSRGCPYPEVHEIVQELTHWKDVN